MANKNATKKRVTKSGDSFTYAEIKKWLGRGGIKALSEELGFDQKYAYHVLAGRSKNIAILTLIRERALKNKEIFDNQSKRFED